MMKHGSNMVVKRIDEILDLEVFYTSCLLLSFQTVQENVLHLVRTADQLLRRSSMDAEGVRQRLKTVDLECENFQYQLDNRRKNIALSQSFFNQAQSVSRNPSSTKHNR